MPVCLVDAHRVQRCSRALLARAWMGEMDAAAFEYRRRRSRCTAIGPEGGTSRALPLPVWRTRWPGRAGGLNVHGADAHGRFRACSGGQSAFGIRARALSWEGAAPAVCHDLEIAWPTWAFSSPSLAQFGLRTSWRSHPGPPRSGDSADVCGGDQRLEAAAASTVMFDT